MVVEVLYSWGITAVAFWPHIFKQVILYRRYVVKWIEGICDVYRVNCSFYFKIGACRHGDRCSRIHNKPTFSQVSVQFMYSSLSLTGFWLFMVFVVYLVMPTVVFSLCICGFNLLTQEECGFHTKWFTLPEAGL